MAIVVRGKSRCALCGELLLHDDELTLIPAGLFARPDSPFHHIWDAGLHGRCFDNMPLSDRAADQLKAYLEAVRARETQERPPSRRSGAGAGASWVSSPLASA